MSNTHREIMRTVSLFYPNYWFLLYGNWKNKEDLKGDELYEIICVISVVSAVI